MINKIKNTRVFKLKMEIILLVKTSFFDKLIMTCVFMFQYQYMLLEYELLSIHC